MTQEEKSLLLKDLCARVPYETMVECSIESGVAMDVVLCPSHITELIDDLIIIKPYLRLKSSMTEEEEIYYDTVYTRLKFYEKEDWLNANYFDYRGLIEKGLAIKAPKDMYK